MSQQSRGEYHVVVLGAGGVGKSCLTAQFVQNVWIESYDPTIEDSYRKQIDVDGRQVMLEILDTAGTEQFTAMRELYMKQGQGFLLVFSIANLNSFHELSELREQIIRIKDDDDIPLVLVGNKCDLEEDRNVQRAAAFQLAQLWGSKPYYETSARRRVNVDEVFVNVCRQIIQKDAAAASSSSRHLHAYSARQQQQQQRRPQNYSSSSPSRRERPARLSTTNTLAAATATANVGTAARQSRLGRRLRARDRCVIL